MTLQPAEPKQGVCEVCWYAKGDSTLKSVRFCQWCSAWMCEDCRVNWPARMKAALRRGFGAEAPTE